MNAKIRTKRRHLYKVLDVIANYKDARRGVVHIDDDFFQKLRPLNEIQIKQALNALESEDVLEIFASDISPHRICVKLTSHAFAYRMHIRETSFRFWFPSVISVVSIIFSATPVVPQILDLLYKALEVVQQLVS